jgi:hypothetical protein
MRRTLVKTSIVPDFISTAEQQALIAWARSAKLKVRNQPDHLLNSKQNRDKQPTSGERKSEFILEDGPPEFYEIQRRITERFHLEELLPEGRQGKVIIHETDSETPEHIDFFKHMGPGFTRATVVVQKAEEGGELFVAGKQLDLPERAMAIYDASEVHAVSLVTSGSRIAFVYGWKDEVSDSIGRGDPRQLRDRQRIQGEQLEARRRAELSKRVGGSV